MAASATLAPVSQTEAPRGAATATAVDTAPRPLPPSAALVLPETRGYRFKNRLLGPPLHTEPEAPPRFSQGVGMVFAAGGVACYAAGVTAGGIAFTALALVAAFLNAAFDLCLGCHMYLFIQRNLRVRPSA